MTPSIKHLLLGGFAAACLSVSAAVVAPTAASAGPLTIAPAADVALPKVTEDVRYRGRRVVRHRYYRGGGGFAPAALIGGLFGAALGAATFGNGYYYGGYPSYGAGYYPAYYGGYYPAYDYYPAYYGGYYPAYYGGYYPAYRTRYVYPRRIRAHRVYHGGVYRPQVYRAGRVYQGGGRVIRGGNVGMRSAVYRGGGRRR
jgi:hypothetical protein